MRSSFQRFRRHFFSNILLARFVIITFTLLGVLLTWHLVRTPAQAILQSLRLVSGQPLPQAAGRTNIVILGTGGSGHEGPNLADTIILASVKLDTGATTLISLPRDFWIPSLRAKINTAYHYGFEKEGTVGGLLLAKSAVSEALGVPVHFAVKIDFSAFTRAIDLLGGVDVEVDRAFTDSFYPISGKENDLCDGDPETRCRYETLNFSAGAQHFDGPTALKFVRSRHSTDSEEGTDFARSKRQEKVLTAVKTKLLSINNLKNSQIYKDLFSLAQQSVVTDIASEYYSTLFQLGLKLKQQPFKTISLEDYLENPPISGRYDNQWVLVPKQDAGLQEYISSILN